MEVVLAAHMIVRLWGSRFLEMEIKEVEKEKTPKSEVELETKSVWKSNVKVRIPVSAPSSI